MQVLSKAVESGHIVQRCLRRRTASGSVIVVLLMVLMLVFSPHPPPPSASSSSSSSSSSSLYSYPFNASYPRLTLPINPPSKQVASVSQSNNQVVPASTEASCQPRHDLLFLKTHKCASSTTQRIFLRYGKEHGLSQALPLHGNYLGSPMPFRPWMLPRALRTPDNKYNMMVVHTRLNADSLAMVMRRGAAWVTIVREPVAQFESLWGYFPLQKFYKMSLEKFANLPYEKVARWRLAKVYGIHQMFFDFGYSTAENITPERMNHILETLNSTFDLVMVAEYYDESLVLLKDMMCWTADDVAYLSINFRRNKSNATRLSKEVREKLLWLSYPDVQIYKFFLRVFEAKVEAFGRSRMEKELAAVRAASKRLAETCLVQEDSPMKARKGMEWTGVVGRVAVRGDIQRCVDVARTEHDMLNEVRDRQKAWVAQGWNGPLSQVVVPPGEPHHPSTHLS